MSHTYTTETLYHFTCSNCKNWWSYATTDTYHPSALHCPHCGVVDYIEPKDPGHIKPIMVKLTPQRIACGD